MNFDHLCKFVIENKLKIKNKKKIKNLLKYFYDIILLNRRKLKLGLIHFEFNDLMTLLLTGQVLKIKFINQDTSASDALKPENMLAKITWQWNLKNVLALIFTLTLFFYFFKILIKNWLIQVCPFLFFRSSEYDSLILFSLNLIFFSFNSLTTKTFTYFIDIIFNFLIHFNLL